MNYIEDCSKPPILLTLEMLGEFASRRPDFGYIVYSFKVAIVSNNAAFIFCRSKENFPYLIWFLN